jgi:cation diffusion facilitator CzcD-associated flavoprotein CzcO
MAAADSPVNDGRAGPGQDDPADVSRESPPDHAAAHVDVLIVGAGLSGIGAAWRLQDQRPGRSYVILEGREALGGTWDLFRYPGIRSDSDMFTFGYPFRPWHGQQVLADGPSIRAYLADTASDAGIDRHIRYRTRVVAASWSSERARWTVSVQVGPDATPGTYTCSFLWICSGYYDYEHPHRPTFSGESDFEGTIVHPQLWPPDLEWDGKRVVVVGSGATAVTLVPALVGRAGSVTMLQRSPTWMTARPSTDRVADALRRRLPAGAAHRILRARNVTLSQAFYQLCRRRPDLASRLLRSGLEAQTDDDALLDAHFTPTYEPWDQRLCVMPDGDLVRAVADGQAEIVTDTIDRFVPEGIRLASGRIVAADLVVLATGLTLLPLGAIELRVDGAHVDPSTRFAYQGLMLSGVPNLALTVGYTNASWTLRADLVARFVTRLLRHMDQHGVAYAVPTEPTDAAPRPLLDMTSGYIRRSEHLFPHQADRNPWRVGQNYLVDRRRLGRADVTEEMTMVTWQRLRKEAGSAAGAHGSGSAPTTGSAESGPGR